MRHVLTWGWIILTVGLLAGCEGASDTTITGPTDGGVQTVSISGPAVNVQGSPCAGNISTQRGDTTTAGTNATTVTPNCSSTTTEAAPAEE